jgi:hypothetical protein
VAYAADKPYVTVEFIFELSIVGLAVLSVNPINIFVFWIKWFSLNVIYGTAFGRTDLTAQASGLLSDLS